MHADSAPGACRRGINIMALDAGSECRRLGELVIGSAVSTTNINNFLVELTGLTSRKEPEIILRKTPGIVEEDCCCIQKLNRNRNFIG
jgi:hypothetical protein